MTTPKEMTEYFKKIGAKGGKSKSKKKLAAIKKNAKKAGRPKGSRNKVKKKC